MEVNAQTELQGVSDGRTLVVQVSHRPFIQ